MPCVEPILGRRAGGCWYLLTEDVDKVGAKAVKLGAKSLGPVMDM